MTLCHPCTVYRLVEHSPRLAMARRHELDEWEGGVMPQAFDERSFWMIVKRYANRGSFVPNAVALYHCMIDEATPVAASATIAFALAYFVIPMDAVPDWIPVSGLVDDGTVLAMTLAIVRAHVTDEHRRKAQEWLA